MQLTGIVRQTGKPGRLTVHDEKSGPPAPEQTSAVTEGVKRRRLAHHGSHQKETLPDCLVGRLGNDRQAAGQPTRCRVHPTDSWEADQSSLRGEEHVNRVAVAAARMLSASTVTCCSGHLSGSRFGLRCRICTTAPVTSAASQRSSPRPPCLHVSPKRPSKCDFIGCGSGFSHEDTKARRRGCDQRCDAEGEGPAQSNYAS